MANTPGALHLRTLSTLNDLSSDQSNTIIFAVPVEVLEAYKGGSTAINSKATNVPSAMENAAGTIVTEEIKNMIKHNK